MGKVTDIKEKQKKDVGCEEEDQEKEKARALVEKMINSVPTSPEETETMHALSSMDLLHFSLAKLGDFGRTVVGLNQSACNRCKDCQPELLCSGCTGDAETLKKASGKLLALAMLIKTATEPGSRIHAERAAGALFDNLESSAVDQMLERVLTEHKPKHSQ